MASETVLSKELDLYEQRREELLRHYTGQYVVIHGAEVLASFTTESEAYEAALARWGNQPFLIRRVAKDDPEIRFPALSIGLISHADS